MLPRWDWLAGSAYRFFFVVPVADQYMGAGGSARPCSGVSLWEGGLQIPRVFGLARPLLGSQGHASAGVVVVQGPISELRAPRSDDEVGRAAHL